MRELGQEPPGRIPPSVALAATLGGAWGFGDGRWAEEQPRRGNGKRRNSKRKRRRQAQRQARRRNRS